MYGAFVFSRSGLPLLYLKQSSGNTYHCLPSKLEKKTLFCKNDFVIFHVLTLCRFLRLLLCCAQVFLCPYCHIFIRNSNRAVWTTSKNHAANTAGYEQNSITPKAEKTEKLSLKMIFLWTWRAQMSSSVQFFWIFLLTGLLALLCPCFKYVRMKRWHGLGPGGATSRLLVEFNLKFWQTIITK